MCEFFYVALHLNIVLIFNIKMKCVNVNFRPLKNWVTTANVRSLNFLTTSKQSMHKTKKRRVSEENRTFNATFADLFAFTAGLPVCLICHEIVMILVFVVLLCYILLWVLGLCYISCFILRLPVPCVSLFVLLPCGSRSITCPTLIVFTFVSFPLVYVSPGIPLVLGLLFCFCQFTYHTKVCIFHFVANAMPCPGLCSCCVCVFCVAHLSPLDSMPSLFLVLFSCHAMPCLALP